MQGNKHCIDKCTDIYTLNLKIKMYQYVNCLAALMCRNAWRGWMDEMRFLTYTVLDMGVLSHPLTQNPACVTDISHRLVSIPLRDPSQTPGVQSKHYKWTCRRRNIFFWFDVMFFILWYKKIIIICMIIQFPKNIVKL